MKTVSKANNLNPAWKLDSTLAERIHVNGLGLNSVVRILYDTGKNYEGRKVKKFVFEFSSLVGDERKVGPYEPGYALELPASGSIGGTSPSCRFGVQRDNGSINIDDTKPDIASKSATQGTCYNDLYYSNHSPLEILEKSLNALARDTAEDLLKSDISQTLKLIKDLNLMLNLAFAAELGIELRVKGLITAPPGHSLRREPSE